VDILTAAGSLKEEGGNLIASTPELRPIPETVEKSLSISDSMSMRENVQLHVTPSARLGGVQLSIEVTVQCTPKELDDLGRKLRKVLQDFNDPSQPEKKIEAAAPPVPPTSEGTEE